MSKKNNSIVDQLIYFLKSIIKQIVFQLFLVLDIIGLITVYYSKFSVPYYIFIILPLIAILIASFNVYREGVADIQFVITNENDVDFRARGGHDGVAQSFEFAVKGYIANFGSKSGLMQDVVIEAGLNNVVDEFLLSKVNAVIGIKKIAKSEITLSYPLMTQERRDDLFIQFPLIVEPGSIITFVLPFTLDLRTFFDKDLNEFIRWLKIINVTIEYKIFQQNKSRLEEYKFNIPVQGMDKAALEFKQMFNK